MLLLSREDYCNGIKENVYSYEYATKDEKPTRKRISKSHNVRDSLEQYHHRFFACSDS